MSLALWASSNRISRALSLRFSFACRQTACSHAHKNDMETHQPNTFSYFFYYYLLFNAHNGVYSFTSLSFHPFTVEQPFCPRWSKFNTSWKLWQISTWNSWLSTMTISHSWRDSRRTNHISHQSQLRDQPVRGVHDKCASHFPSVSIIILVDHILHQMTAKYFGIVLAQIKNVCYH